MTTRRAGIRAVAERAGVGISTVSRVFTGSAKVDPVLRQRVIEAADALGYRPDILAQSLRRGRTLSAGFIADDLGNHLNTEIATGAEGALRAQGYSLLVMNSEMERSLDAENIHVLRARRLDALMMTPVTEDDPELVDALRELDVPIVIVEGDLPGVPQASFVVSDHRAGTAEALRHLVGLGHRRISVLTGPDDFRSARQRALACADVAAEAGPGVRISREVTELTAAGGRRATQAALGRREPASAILVGGDQLLTGALLAIAGAGLGLGVAISLVTTDPVALAAVYRPPLATITRDALSLGQHAAEIMLLALADATQPPRTVTLPTVYTPKASVGPPPHQVPGRKPR